MKIIRTAALFLICIFLPGLFPSAFAADAKITFKSCPEYGNVGETIEVSITAENAGSASEPMEIDLSLIKDGIVFDSVTSKFVPADEEDVTYLLSAPESGKYNLLLSRLLKGKKIVSASKTIYVFEGKSSFSDMGVCTHYDYNQPFRKLSDMKAAKAAGFTMIRDECRWDKVETTKGRYEIPQHIKDYVDYANRNGIEVLLILAFGNSLYTGTKTPGMPVGTEQLNAFGNYCKFVAKEFCGKVKYFEIWNEPNHEIFNPGGASAADYVQVMKTAYNAVKSVNKDAYILGISEDGARPEYTKAVLNAGGGAYMDAVSLHPYSCWYGGVFDESSLTLEQMITNNKKVIMDAGLNLPIWITEVGYMTSTGRYTYEQQGAYNVRTAIEFKSDDRIDKIFFYELHDSGLDASSTEANFGMLEYDGTPKAAHSMLLNANNILANADFVKKWQGNSYYALYEFRDRVTDEDIFVLWTKKGKKRQIQLSANANQVSSSCGGDNAKVLIDLSKANSGKEIACYDAYGAVSSLLADSAFTADFKPMFLVCKEPKKEKSFNLSLENGNIIAEGRIESANTEVTIRAAEKNGANYYINQAATDETGSFRFSFKAPQNSVSEVFVYNGALNSGKINNNGFDTDLIFKAADREVSKISDIKPGETVKAQVSVDNQRYAGLGELCFAAAVYTADNKMIVIETDKKELSEDGKGEFSIDIPTDKLESWKKVKFFLWDINDLKSFMYGMKK